LVQSRGRTSRPALDEQARARRRRQALEWLGADLADGIRQSKAGSPHAKAEIIRRLRHRKYDPDLAGIRDEGPRKVLSEAERKECRSLWTEVDLLLKVGAKT
jgi:hypothetical protein